MQTVILENTNRYRLDSHNNGAAYTMLDKQTGESKFVQPGDDAVAFREEYDAIYAAHIDPESVWYRRSWNACLEYLFSDCI